VQKLARGGPADKDDARALLLAVARVPSAGELAADQQHGDVLTLARKDGLRRADGDAYLPRHYVTRSHALRAEMWDCG
jgi:hypothetical protein